MEPETPLGAFSYVQLVNPSFGIGVICGQAGGTRVLATDDAGDSWRRLPLPDQNGLDCGSVVPSPGTISGFCFGTAQVGWACSHVQARAQALSKRPTTAAWSGHPLLR